MNIENHSYDQVYRMYEDYLRLKNYSKHTIKAYLSNFTAYYEWCTTEKQEVVYDQYTVRSYLVELTRKGKKWQTINNHYSSMRNTNFTL